MKDTTDKIKQKISKAKENNDVVKYAIPAAVVAFGFFVGGNLTQGVYAGILTSAGFWILVEKMRTFYPGAYNWLIDHSVEADFIVSGMACLFLGFTVTGIIAAATVNLLVSIILENYRENTGKIEGVKTSEFSDVLGIGIAKAKEGFNSVKDAVQKARDNEEVMQ